MKTFVQEIDEAFLNKTYIQLRNFKLWVDREHDSYYILRSCSFPNSNVYLNIYVNIFMPYVVTLSAYMNNVEIPNNFKMQISATGTLQDVDNLFIEILEKEISILKKQLEIYKGE